MCKHMYTVVSVKKSFTKIELVHNISSDIVNVNMICVNIKNELSTQGQCVRIFLQMFYAHLLCNIVFQSLYTSYQINIENSRWQDY